jgi:endonuclease YncB( thermonuclease family)
MGLLKVNGVIELDQFWPEQGSDGDTIRVQLDGPFLFQPYPNQPFQPTTAFDNAQMHGKPVLHQDHTTGATGISTRLQGIDAPEMHYQPQPPQDLGAAVAAHRAEFHQYNKEYRQPYGETATVKLAEWLLNTYGQQQLSCIVTTQVDTPNDVFDVYGRFIGTIFIPDQNGNEEVLTDNGQATIPATDVNRHCVQQGWAFPTFYSSMKEEEITPLLQADKQAQEQNSGLWPLYQSQIGALDTSLLYDRPTHSHTPTYDPAQDTGAVIFPKLFRRLCTYTALAKAGIIDMTFKEYLQREREYCFLLSEFLEQGLTASTPHSLDEFIDDNENLTKHPYELVFQEKASSLRDKNTGQIIKNW